LAKRGKVDGRVPHAEEKVIEKSQETVLEGDYLAKVPVELIIRDHEWSPSLSMADALKLDRVRLALRQGDIATAAKEADIYKLTPVAAE
jgi:hypothetical protein